MSEFWKNKKVLVTGGTGFLGKHLTESLLKLGATVKIVDFRKSAQEIAGADFYETDIRGADQINGLCQGIDVVFHLAAMPSIAKGRACDYYEVNVKGTCNVLVAALNNNVKKLVHISSSTVYGIPREFPLKETSPLGPLGKYGRSKLAAENVCWEFVEKGLSVSIIRPRVIIGPGRIGIFSILFDRITSNKPVYTIGKGDNVFQFTNVLDMSDACIRAAEYEKSDLFNIGSEEIMPVREELSSLIRYAKSKSRVVSIPQYLANISLKTLSLLGISPLVEEQFAIADRNFKLDTTYAQQYLNWRPRYSNLESLCQAYDWYIANVNKDKAQYNNVLGVIGKFRHSKMGGFQQ